MGDSEFHTVAGRVEDTERVASPGARGRHFAGDVLRLTTGTLLAQLLTVIASPILTRLFLPEAFGLSAVFVSVVGLVSAVVCLRYDLAIMLPDDQSDAASVLWLSLTSALAVASVAALVFVFAGTTLSSWLKAPDLTRYLPLAPVAILLAGIFSSLNHWNSRTRRYGRLSIARVSASAVTVSSKIGGGYAGLTTGGTLIAGTVGGSVVSSAVLWGQIWRDDRRVLRDALKLRRILCLAKRYRKFPLFATWTALAGALSLQLPVMLISSFFSASTVGHYALGYGMIHLPVSLIGSSVGQVFYQRACRAKGDGTLLDLVDGVLRRLFLIGAFPFLMLSVIGEDVFSLVFGTNWSEAGLYTQILSPWVFFLFLSGPFSVLFSVMEKQEVGTLWNLVVLVFRFGSLLLGGLTGNIILALSLFSFTGVVSSMGIVYYLTRRVGFQGSHFVPGLVCALAISVPLCGVLLAAVLLQLSSVVVVSLGVVCTFVYYWLASRRDPELRAMVRSFFHGKKNGRGRQA